MAFEQVLISLDDETWAKLNGPRRNEEGMLVTGDPVVDRWEREAWEEAQRVQ